MAVFDLDAYRANRAAHDEQGNEPHQLKLGGRTYLLHPRLPVEFTDLLVEGRMGAATKLLLVNPDDDWEPFRAAVPDTDDLNALTEQLYGLGEGESPASAHSSTNGGVSLRPISDGSTPASPAASPPHATGRQARRSGSANSAT